MRRNALLLGLILCSLPPAESAAPAAAAVTDPRRDATVIAVEKVMPTVVNIATKTVVEKPVWIRSWFGQVPGIQSSPEYSAGSGVIVDEEGYVLTNVHVVEGATEVWVKLANGTIYQAETVAGAKSTDVAVLKLKGKAGEKFPAAQLAAENDLLLGETVITLGNPFGLGGSVSRGILSSKSRREKIEEGGSMAIEDWLQTDAAINPGNSGGPLINVRGEVIGLNVAVYKEAQGIGFAIPIKRVLEAFSELFTPEALRSLWFGATFETKANGFAVKKVERDSPAAKAGLQLADRVSLVNGQTPRSLIELHRFLLPRGNSRELELTVQRGGGNRKVPVRLVPQAEYFNAAYIRKRSGLTVEPFTALMAQRMGLQPVQALVVTAVEAESPAAEAGIQRGYILSKIDELSIPHVVAAGKLLHQHDAGQSVKILATSPRNLRSGLFEVVLR